MEQRPDSKNTGLGENDVSHEGAGSGFAVAAPGAAEDRGGPWKNALVRLNGPPPSPGGPTGLGKRRSARRRREWLCRGGAGAAGDRGGPWKNALVRLNGPPPSPGGPTGLGKGRSARRRREWLRGGGA